MTVDLRLAAIAASAVLLVASGCSSPAPREEPCRPARLAKARPAAPRVAAPAAPSCEVAFDVKDVPVSEVMDLIARRAGKNIVCEPDIEDRVTLSLHDISWRDAVDFVAERTHCEVSTVHGVLYVTQPPRVTIQTLPGF